MLNKSKNILTKSHRITKSAEYKENFKKGRSIKDRHLKLYYSGNQENKMKVGIIISKKIKEKVKRNKYKRIIREYFRLNLKTMNSGRNVIIILQNEIQPVKYGVIAKAIQEILKKAGIIGNEKIIGSK